MKKWPEYMVTTDQCDIAYAFLDAIAIASTELVYMGISLTNVKLDACFGGGVRGDSWQQMLLTRPGRNLWAENMTGRATQCDLAHLLSCQLRPLVCNTTVYFTMYNLLSACRR